MIEPGLDWHEWESEWESLEPDLRDSPAQTLPQVDDLIARMLAGYGIAVGGEDVTAEGTDDEIRLSWEAAHDIATRVDRGDDVDPGDIGEAVDRYRDIYDHLLTQPHE